MADLNQSTEPNNDFSGWVDPPETPPQPRRWCPTHRRYENNPKTGRLRCGPAWRELYSIEREVEVEMMNPNVSILRLAEEVKNLVVEIQDDDRVIAEPPTKPQVPPRPPSAPPPILPRNGRGGVPLP